MLQKLNINKADFLKTGNFSNKNVFILLYEEKHERTEKMGYAIFAARKLMLTNRLNQVRFRILALSQQQMTLSQAAGDKQRYLSYTKNIFNNLSNSAVNNFLTAQKTQLEQQYGQNGINDPTAFSNAMNNAWQQINLFSNTINQNNQALDLSASYEMERIKDIENQIELEKKTLETQEKAMTAELQEIEKKEDSEIKNSAPKFA